jgi:ribulose-phosphate 3-epimerase
MERQGAHAEIEVDGGINEDTAPRVVDAGARVLVAGTSVYRAPEGIGAAIHDLRVAGRRGLPDVAE